MKREKTSLILVKNYKKGLIFLEAKTVKDITNHLLKVVFTIVTIVFTIVFTIVSVYSLFHTIA